jgi:hypothetical protein
MFASGIGVKSMKNKSLSHCSAKLGDAWIVESRFATKAVRSAI